MLRFSLWLLMPVVCLAQPSSYLITTIAGNGTSGFSGDNGAPTSAELNNPISVALDSSGSIYIADSANNRIRKVSGGKITTYAGSGSPGFAGDGAKATGAEFYDPNGVWVDNQGNLDIADLYNEVIRQVNPSSGIVNTIAGSNVTPNYWGDGGPATSAQMAFPFAVVTDSYGNLYISDSKNNRVRMVANGNISLFAGNGWSGTAQGDGGQAAVASLYEPYGLAVDAAGNLYIADSANNRVRRVAANGIISTVAGNGTAGVSGDGGPATSAELNRPFAVAVDAGGNLFIADYNNWRIREVTPNGIITTIAGGTGVGYTGDGFIATNAKLNFPTGVAVDSSGHVYIADSSNNVIRMLTPMAPSVPGGSIASAGAFGGFQSAAPGSWIEIYGSNLSADSRSWSTADFSGSTAPAALDGTSVTIGGQAAFVYYISGGQIDVQVPSGVASGPQPVVVKTPFGNSSSYTLTVNSVQPGLLAPPNFKIAGTQYVTAQFSDGTYVLPTGAIAGYTSRPAKAGDIITIYGIGFGPVSPATPAGQIAPANTILATPVQFTFGQSPATANYSGLAPNAVGLYQFNLVVPAVTPGGKTALTFTLGGTAGTQTLFVATQ